MMALRHCRRWTRNNRGVFPVAIVYYLPCETRRLADCARCAEASGFPARIDRTACFSVKLSRIQPLENAKVQLCVGFAPLDFEQGGPFVAKYPRSRCSQTGIDPLR